MNQWSNFIFLTQGKKLQNSQSRLRKTYLKVSQLETGKSWIQYHGLNRLTTVCHNIAGTVHLFPCCSIPWLFFLFQYRDAGLGNVHWLLSAEPHPALQWQAIGQNWEQYFQALLQEVGSHSGSKDEGDFGRCSWDTLLNQVPSRVAFQHSWRRTLAEREQRGSFRAGTWQVTASSGNRAPSSLVGRRLSLAFVHTCRSESSLPASCKRRFLVSWQGTL